ncbi:RHS repeat domain-containing protein [Flectobacillus major]|uniref:RHS repeat domain-containing protein n=1 Tax=Flectobacillus major TaxID=103 RepID=UPI0005C5F4ED|nr:RHS repeat-associated core domain-containing protein [Flectobacillus major]
MKLDLTLGSVTDYSTNFFYKNNILYQIGYDEGRIVNGIYEYNITDHLGNLRVSFKDSAGIATPLQSLFYDPWGLSMKGMQINKNSTNFNKHQYNGKELQLETGWNDFGARMYGAAEGRWWTIDPLAEALNNASPFVFSLNNPISFKDIGGSLPILINGRVADNSERGNPKYWAHQILATIRNSGIPNPHSTIKDEFYFVDGDRGVVTDYGRSYADPSAATEAGSREIGGYLQAKEDFSSILSLLHKNTKTGKIDETIQIYTHSRGGAFGQGYLEGLLEMIKLNSSLFAEPDKVIDLVLNLAPHQSGFIPNHQTISNNFSMHDDGDILSGNRMKSVKAAFSFDSAKGVGASHRNSSFANSLNTFLQVYQNGTNNNVINDFINQMQNLYGIEVTVH